MFNEGLWTKWENPSCFQADLIIQNSTLALTSWSTVQRWILGILAAPNAAPCCLLDSEPDFDGEQELYLFAYSAAQLEGSWMICWPRLHCGWKEGGREERIGLNNDQRQLVETWFLAPTEGICEAEPWYHSHLFKRLGRLHGGTGDGSHATAINYSYFVTGPWMQPSSWDFMVWKA